MGVVIIVLGLILLSGFLCWFFNSLWGLLPLAVLLFTKMHSERRD